MMFEVLIAEFSGQNPESRRKVNASLISDSMSPRLRVRSFSLDSGLSLWAFDCISIFINVSF